MSTPPSAPQFSPAPSAHHPSTTQPKNGFGIAALVLGIVGIVLGLIPAVGIFFAIVLGLVGIVLGVLGFLRANKGVATNKVMAIIGTVLSVIAIFVGIISLIVSIAFVNSVNDAIEESQNDPVSGAAAPSSADAAPATDGAAPTQQAAAGRFPGQMEKDVVGEAGTEITVNDVAITAGALTPESDDLGQYYCTDISATNNSTETLSSFGPFSFKVQNPSGSATDSTFSMIDGELQTSDLAPGGQTSGKVCFDADQVAPGQNVVLYEELISLDDSRGAWITTIG